MQLIVIRLVISQKHFVIYFYLFFYYYYVVNIHFSIYSWLQNGSI